MSSGLKNENNYSDQDFYVVISEDEDSESGYSALVSGTDTDGDLFEDERDVENVLNNLLFGNWIIKKQKKI